MAKIKKKKYCQKPYGVPFRPSREFALIINRIKARYLLAGKTPPSTAYITKKIAEKLEKEKILTDEFIRL